MKNKPTQLIMGALCVILIITLCIPVYAQDAFFVSLGLARGLGTIYESESNNTNSTADRTDNDYDNYGSISSSSDVDWWVVKFTASGYANFWLGNIPSGCDYNMKLYSTDGTLLASSSNSGNVSELIGEYWVLSGVEYFVRIHSSSGSSTSQYWFRAKNYPYHGYAGVFSGGAYQGISAKITVPSSLPDVSDSGESAWVSSNIDDNGKWIQTGAIYYSGYNSFKTYTEHYENGIYSLTEWGTHVRGAQISYKVEYNSSDQKWHAYISGVDKVGATLATQNIGVQAHAEVHKKDIEMGPFTFTEMKVKNSSGIWINNSGTLHADSPYTVIGSATTFTVSGP